MLSQRLTSVFKVVSIYDESTLDIPTKLMTLYVQKRDFSLIEEEVKKLEKKPTIFHCYPLKADKEYLVDNMVSDGVSNHWPIFRHHVTKADNYTIADGTPVIKLDDDGLVSSDLKDVIPRDIAQEIASVIVHKANETTKPFMMPATWLQTRIRSLALRAQTAPVEIVTEKTTE